VELYCGVFQNLGETARVVSAEFGGLVLVVDRQTVTILTSSGQQLAAWKWNNPPMVKLLIARTRVVDPDWLESGSGSSILAQSGSGSGSEPSKKGTVKNNFFLNFVKSNLK
jgi:hypothetical protein